MTSELKLTPHRQGDRLSTMFRRVGLSLPPRDPNEVARGSTSLELLFDLATVVAVAAAAIDFAHDLQAGHLESGIAKFCANFFMTWLAWSNYTWLASGYDNRSTAFRSLTIVIMFGSLALAAGIQSDRSEQPIWLALIGFTIMRAGMIALWLGAAMGDAHGRPTALRYAVGIGVMQVYWHLLINQIPPQAALYLPLFALGATGELVIPMLVKRGSAVIWNHDHIIDRYGAFNVIVLGECFAAITAILASFSTHGWQVFWLAGLCGIIAGSMWRLYFSNVEQLSSRRPRDVLIWSYGHYILFAAGAATAAGFLTRLGEIRNRSLLTEQGAALSVGVPVALYVTALWLVRDRTARGGLRHWVLPSAAALIVVCSTLASRSLELIAVLLVVSALAVSQVSQRGG